MTQTIPMSKQLDLSELQKTFWDVVIVGAGPSGSAAARQLAKSKHNVLILDKEFFPRRKVCGDGLIADSIEFLKSEGLYDRVASEARLSNTATVISPSGHSFECPGRFMVLKRERFDSIMVESAAQSGATFAQASISKIEYDTDGLPRLITKADKIIKCKFCLIATGGQLSLAKKSGMKVKASPHAFAVSRYLKSNSKLSNLIIRFDSRIIPGFAWVWPMNNGLFNVGAGSTIKDSKKVGKTAIDAMASLLCDKNLVGDIFRNYEFVSSLKGAPIFCNLKGCQFWDNQRVLVSGETIGTTYGFSGEGIGKAMESGRIAGEVISEAIFAKDSILLEKYSQRIKNELSPKYRNYQIAEKWFARPRLNDFLCKRLNNSKSLLNKFADFADDRSAVSTLNGLGLLIKSFVK